jgi:flagellar motor protein MotB
MTFGRAQRAFVALSCVVSGCALSACVSKSLYQQQVDEAVRWRAQSAEYKKSLGVAAELRARLEAQVKAEERKTAICEVSLRGLRERGEKHDAEVAAVTARLKATSDDVNELRAKLAGADEGVKGCEARIAQLRANQAAAARREPDLSDAVKILQPEVDQSNGALTLLRPRGAVVLRLPHALLFRRRSPVLTREGGELLGRVADALKQLKERRIFTIEGHEDAEAPPRRFGTPFDLSLTQSYRVALELVRQGLAASRVQAMGLGASQPLGTPGAENAALLNRRIEVRITPAPPAEKLDVIGPEAGGVRSESP